MVTKTSRAHRGDGDGGGLVCHLDGDDADDLLGRVRAHDSGGPAGCGLLGCGGEPGRVGKMAATPDNGHGDVLPVGRFVHT
jgi:hypothetical protein